MHIYIGNSTLKEYISNAAFQALHLEEWPIRVCLQLTSTHLCLRLAVPELCSRASWSTTNLVIGSKAHIPPRALIARNAK